VSKSESKTKGNRDIAPEKVLAAIRLFLLDISAIPMIQAELKAFSKMTILWLRIKATVLS
jgi:hypothetical protein